MTVLRARSVGVENAVVSASAVRAGKVDPHQLFERGSRTLTVAEPIPLGADPVQDARVLRTLAECAAATIDVRWRYTGQLPWPVRALVHLPAPEGGPEPPALATWRAEHRYGQCCYRLGPDLLIVTDERPWGEGLRMTVGGSSAAALRDLFRAEGAISTSGLADDKAELLAGMRRWGLAVDVNDVSSVLLPYRLRTWPVPHSSG